MSDTDNSTNPNDAEKNKAPANQQSAKVKDGFSTQAKDDNVQLKLEEYIPKYLGPASSNGCFHDTGSPQMVPSILIAVALSITGNQSVNIGKNNFWNLDFDKSLGCEETPDTNNKAAFKTYKEGVEGIIKYMHSVKAQSCLSPLKPKIEDDDDAMKNTAMENIFKTLNSSKAEEWNKTAKENIEKYKLREWDSPDKKDAEPDKDYANKMAKIMKRISEYKHKYGVGFDVKRAGEIVTITRLPKGKTTPCEPIYPDLITVSDTIPEWIMTQTTADYNKKALSEARKKAGLKDEDPKQTELDDVNSQLDDFAEGQFAAWAQANGKDISSDDKIAEVKKEYYAAASNDDKNFVDSIYCPDDSSKKKYQALASKKYKLQDTINERTVINQKWDESVKKTSEDIKARDAKLGAKDDKKTDDKDKDTKDKDKKDDKSDSSDKKQS